MHFKLNKSLLAVAVSSMLVAPLAEATNGYFSHGYSTKEKGLAGAGVALSQDSMANASNPAGMAFVGDRMDVGMQLFSPSPRSYTSTGAPTNFFNAGPPPAFTFGVGTGNQSIESENDFFLIPSFGYNKALDANSSWGVSVYGNGGMNTKYEGGVASADGQAFGGPAGPVTAPGTFGAGTAGVNLAQLFVNATLARKLDKDHALGASIIYAYQRFAASGLDNFGGFSLDPTNLSGNRNSYSSGFGFKIGYQGKVAEGVRVGVSYQSEMAMSEFDEYRGLFAEQGDFDIPSTYTIGVSFDVGNSGKLVADVQKINYTDVAAISNPISNLTGVGGPPPTGGCGQGVFAKCLGGADGAGFGWEDMTIVKIGYQWTTDDTDWRVGVSKGDQPIPDSEVMFNILAPAVIETHVTFGLTKRMDNNQELNFAAMYAPNNEVTGPNAFDPAQQIKLEMSQMDFQVGWAWKY